MISDVFKRWLLDLEKKFLIKSRKVLIFLDNCSGKELTFILKKKENYGTQFFFQLIQNQLKKIFPPNMTSILKPMELGIIINP
jgi:hypothetical protein